MMGIFKKHKQAAPTFSLEEYEPVLRCSICTGEQVACMRNKVTDQFHEIMLIRSPSDLDKFCQIYMIQAEKVRKVY